MEQFHEKVERGCFVLGPKLRNLKNSKWINHRGVFGCVMHVPLFRVGILPCPILVILFKFRRVAKEHQTGGTKAGREKVRFRRLSPAKRGIKSMLFPVFSGMFTLRQDDSGADYYIHLSPICPLCKRCVPHLRIHFSPVVYLTLAV